MIHELLEANFMAAIGDDETKLAYITSSAADLTQEIFKHPTKLVPFTVLGLDAECDDDDPLLIEAEGKIKRHWSTYANKFKGDRPRQLIRAVILESLAQVGAKGNLYPAVIFYLGSEYVRMKSLSNEEGLLTSFLTGLGAKVESTIVRQWSPPVERKLIKKYVDDATSNLSQAPTFDGTSISTAVAALWNTETNTFDTKKAKQVAESIHTDIGQALGESTEKLKQPINELATMISVEMLKNNLIWWKETKYSESARTSYRGLDPSLIAFLMALDVHANMSETHPTSVEHLIRESIGEIVSPNEVTVLDFANDLISSLADRNLTHLLDQFELRSAGCNCLVGTLAALTGKVKISKGDLRKSLNIDSSQKLSSADFGTWCFKDMQALRLIKSLSSRKK